MIFTEMIHLNLLLALFGRKRAWPLFRKNYDETPPRMSDNLREKNLGSKPREKKTAFIRTKGWVSISMYFRAPVFN